MIIAPVKGSLNSITYGSAGKVVAGLWIFISRESLMFESRFAVFEEGRMVGWGLVALRDAEGEGMETGTGMGTGTAGLVGAPTGAVE